VQRLSQLSPAEHQQVEEDAKKILALEDQKRDDEAVAQYVKEIEATVEEQMNGISTIRNLQAARELNKERTHELVTMRSNVKQMKASESRCSESQRLVANRARHKQVLQAIRSICLQVLKDMRCIARWGSTLGSRCAQVADSLTVLTARAAQGETNDDLDSVATTELAVLKHMLLSLYPSGSSEQVLPEPFSNRGVCSDQGAQALRNLEITLRSAAIYVADAARRVDPDVAVSCMRSSGTRLEQLKSQQIKRPWLPSPADHALAI